MIGWVDLESTGLDPNTDSILEFVCVMTDDDLEALSTFGPQVVRPGILTPPFHVWHPAVQAMHARSGLIKEIEAGVDIGWLDTQMIQWLCQTWPDQRGTVPLGGSTIGFDRSFMKKHLPRTEAWFHYRSIDISSVKELVKRWQPNVYDERPQVTDEDKAHRAFEDIMGTLTEAHFYKRTLFQRDQNW